MKLKKSISAILAGAVAIVNLSVSANAYTNDVPYSYSIPNKSTFTAPDEFNNEEDTEFYAALLNAAKEKAEKYRMYKMGRTSLPSSVNLNVSWQRQLNEYFCGPATATIILKNIGFSMANQNALAGSDYLRTIEFGQTPWYSGTTQTDLYYFNMAYGLNQWQYDYRSPGASIYPYEVFNNGSKDEYLEKYKFTLSDGYPVPLNGNPKLYSFSSGCYFGKYAEGHWLVIEGYENNGSIFKIVDPAAGLSGFTEVQSKYNATDEDVKNFITHGVIW